MGKRFLCKLPGIRIAFYHPGVRTGLHKYFHAYERQHGELAAVLLSQFKTARYGYALPFVGADIAVWCFVCPAGVLGRKGYYYGAFRIVDQRITGLLYTRVSFNWLSIDLQSGSYLAFWMARILSLFNRNAEVAIERQHLLSWARALQRSCYPVFERLFIKKNWRFAKRASVLNEESDVTDCIFSPDSGLDMMPWLNWPACIEYQPCIWFWRPSRFGKVMDSRKALMTSDITKEAK